MKQNFEPSWVQAWWLVGLTPWQEALVRNQTALAMSEEKHKVLDLLDRTPRSSQVDGEPRGPNCPEVIQWKSEPHFNDALAPWDILLVSSSVFQATSDQKIDSLLGGDRMERPLKKNEIAPTIAIRLLWDWSPAGRVALRQLIEQRWFGTAFHGVIADPESLRSWIRISLARGGKRPFASHPILSQVSIPRLQPN